MPTSTATRTRERHAAGRAFTLLEVVVALAVTATVLVVLQRATTDALRARGLLADATARRGALRAAVVGLASDPDFAAQLKQTDFQQAIDHALKTSSQPRAREEEVLEKNDGAPAQ